jgi:hypothetical protein
MVNIIIDKLDTKRWYNDKGELHRLDGPAIEYANGNRCWYIHNKLHRVDGPAFLWGSGDAHWYYNGLLHREDGPAIDNFHGSHGHQGSQEWLIHGVHHRLDGPAIIYNKYYHIWFINGVRINVFSNEEFLKIVKLRAFL